jgi:hypothetical protein
LKPPPPAQPPEDVEDPSIVEVLETEAEDDGVGVSLGAIEDDVDERVEEEVDDEDVDDVLLSDEDKGVDDITAVVC